MALILMRKSMITGDLPDQLSHGNHRCAWRCEQGPRCLRQHLPAPETTRIICGAQQDLVSGTTLFPCGEISLCCRKLPGFSMLRRPLIWRWFPAFLVSVGKPR